LVLKKVSWRFNLILLIVLLLSVSLLFQLFYVIPYIQAEELKGEQSHQDDDARNIAVFLNTKIEKSLEDLREMSGNSTFFDMDPVDQSATLRRYLELVPLTSIFAMDSEGWFVSSSQSDISAWQTKAWPELDVYRIPYLEGGLYFGTPTSYFEGTQVRVSFSVPVVSDSDEPIGVMTSGIYLNEWIDWVNAYSLGEGMEAYVVDLRGTVIAHSGIDLFALEDGPLSLNYSDRPWVQDFIEGEPEGHSEYTYDGGQHYATRITVDPIGWGVMVEMSIQQVLAGSNVLSGQLLTLNVLLFIIALPLSLFFTRQITNKRNRMDEELRNYNERLEEMVDEKTEELMKAERFAAIGRIASIIGHELRNPLAVIKNSVFFLTMKLEKDADESVARNMQLIDREVNRSNAIISDLLDFARGPRQPLLQTVYMDDLVQDAVSRIEIPEGVEVETSLGAVQSTKVDPDMILRAFLNLISNGVDAMPKGGVLSLETKANDGNIEISIRDTGEGIQEENMEKLFTPLFSTKAKGVGLGLYITKSLVEAHNGTIGLESVEGEGSTFTITLPISEGD